MKETIMSMTPNHSTPKTTEQYNMNTINTIVRKMKEEFQAQNIENNTTWEKRLKEQKRSNKAWDKRFKAQHGSTMKVIADMMSSVAKLVKN